MTTVIPVSPAEKAVLDELMCDGPTNTEIADRLGLSENTVKIHLKHLMGRAAVTSRTALAVALFRGRYRIRVVAQPSVHLRFKEGAA